ncbi:HdaA/DnaA family protein [Aestuariivirga sp.]|uniref:HdaA/DnaA family protein n=1 Tax=Aestuariivirga sp. TaxID=2650926 RepID=UPI0039E49CA7
MTPSRQLVLELPHRAAFGREDFLVTDSNAAAVAMIDRWPDWPAHGVVLVGPSGSGKSHLVEVWRARSQATRIAASELTLAMVPEIVASGAVAIEDAPSELDEAALFHLLNAARAEGAQVLITSEALPLGWSLRIPDLLSRLKALPVAQLGAPDDALLRGVLVKLFADRQLAVEEAVISYLLLRMPRQLAAANAIVSEIDRKALEEKAGVTRPFVSRVLQGFTEPGFSDED